MLRAREWALLCVGLLATTLACGEESAVPLPGGGDAPAEDGDRVILYDVDVLEDDSRCDAEIPYKPSKEQMTVVWHTNRDITMYARGGLYERDVTLDENGEYTDDAALGPCLPGSTLWGQLDRQGGRGLVVCKKRDCDVYIHTDVNRHVAGADAGTGASSSASSPASPNAPDAGY